MECYLVRALFESMLCCEDRGDYLTMRTHIETSASDIIQNGDTSTLREFSKLLIRVVEAIDMEASLGEGALLKAEHPVIRSWSRGRWLPLKMAT